jgi:hypothetical protein
MVMRNKMNLARKIIEVKAGKVSTMIQTGLQDGLVTDIKMLEGRPLALGSS